MKMDYQPPQIEVYKTFVEAGFAASIVNNDSDMEYDNGGDAW